MSFLPRFTLPLLCTSESLAAQAKLLAEYLEQPLFFEGDPAALMEYPYLLILDTQGLALQQTGRKAPGPIRASFTEGAVDHRRKFGGGKGQMIAKAVGINAGVYPQVLDVTAGLGRDAFVLASLGCLVQMIERSPIVYCLLQEGLARAKAFAEDQDSDLLAILTRMHLLAFDARDYLRSLAVEMQPDVIYLDPMFPARNKTADVKKEMRAFHDIVGSDADAGELLEHALRKARYRVIVKRPRKAEPLQGRQPTYELNGKSSRYDIYSLKKLPDALPSRDH